MLSAVPPTKKAKVAMHAVMAAFDLVGQSFGVNRQWIGVRHLEHRGDAAHDRGERSRFQVFLVGQARLAEMHLGVDDARQQMQAPAVDHFAGRGARKVADGREPAGAHA